MSRKIVSAAQDLAPHDSPELQMHLWSDDPKDPLYRVTLEREWRREGLLTISEEQMTSTDHKRAKVAEVLNKQVLTEQQAEWLLVALARALGATVETKDVRNAARELVPATTIEFARLLNGG